jgi:two-component system, sensor histidine kinase PdtaS
MAEDSVVSPQPIQIATHGDLGDVSADIATPLAVTLAELLQNAVEHAFEPESGTGPDNGDDGASPDTTTIGHVDVTLSNEGGELTVAVRDDGRGLPEGFDIEKTTSLGLSIVRDLVASQLEGRIVMEGVPAAQGGGTSAVISVPVRASR